MSRSGWPYGSALTKDKTQIRYFSPSALTAANPDSTEGCLRRYWYEYKDGRKPPQTAAQTQGVELHEQIEAYLTTGEKNLGSLALSGLHMIPKPGPGLQVEWDIVGGDLEKAPVRAAGVPVVGFIDLVNTRGTNQGATDITDTIDPPHTVEVLDWKSSSDPKWVKTPQEMAQTIQMTTYGKWAITVYPETEHVRLSHGYFITKGRHAPRKVSLRVHRDQIEKRWEYVDSLAGSVIDVVKETDPNKVPGNTRACGAFRGCPHREYCTAAMHNSLAGLIGQTAAGSLLDFVKTPEERPQMTTSLLDRLKGGVAAKVDVESEKKRLQREEVETKYPGFAATLTELGSLGMGFPKLEGEAQRVYVILNEREPDAGGELGGFTFQEPAQLYQVLEEARGIAKERGLTPAPTPAVQEVSLLPPDAPESNPALASEGPPTEPVVTDAASAIEAMASDAPKKGRGRPKKGAVSPASAEATPDVEIASVSDGVVTPSEIHKPRFEETQNVIPEGQIYFYVDCIPSLPYQSFWPMVILITDAMAKRFDGADYRTTSPDGPLGFSRWKGVLAAALRETPIAPGHYVLDGAMTDTGAVVVEAMRDIILKRGGVLVRGIR